MSEIEKMYKNAEIKPFPTCKNCDMLDEYWSNGTYCSTCKCDKDNDECNIANYMYPPFTAEKQLELIKFITSLGVCEIENWNDKGFHFAIKRERIYPTMFLSLSNINLQETLADVINNLWQDLTEEEKQQVKGILG